MKVEVSDGELVDKMVILRIKQERIDDAERVANVSRELALLEASFGEISPAPPEELVAELKTVNEALWEIEDEIRRKESRQEFDEDFIQLARSVYITNDRRAEAKRKINLFTKSELIEEKSYEDYGAGAGGDGSTD